jgi:hypothetical protein
MVIGRNLINHILVSGDAGYRNVTGRVVIEKASEVMDGSSQVTANREGPFLSKLIEEAGTFLRAN